MKAFIKPFEVPQRSVEIKIYLNFFFQYNFQKCMGREGLSDTYIKKMENLLSNQTKFEKVNVKNDAFLTLYQIYKNVLAPFLRT